HLLAEKRRHVLGQLRPLGHDPRAHRRRNPPPHRAVTVHYLTHFCRQYARKHPRRHARHRPPRRPHRPRRTAHLRPHHVHLHPHLHHCWTIPLRQNPPPCARIGLPPGPRYAQIPGAARRRRHHRQCRCRHPPLPHSVPRRNQPRLRPHRPRQRPPRKPR